MFFHRVTVLECGASRTAIGLFSLRPAGRLRLENCAGEALTVEPGCEEEWLEKTQAALQALRARTGVAGPVVLVLPPHLTLAKFIRTPRVDPAQCERIIRFEAQQSIPYALADVVWDSAPAGEAGPDLGFMLCAAKREAVEALCQAVESAGFRPCRVVSSPLATLAACRVERENSTAPVLVANLGARSTTFLLVEPRRFQARTLPLGGNLATQQIAEGNGCDFGRAEALKLTDCPRHLLEFAAESFASRLAQEITRSLLHFHRQAGAGNPSRVLLTGGAARLPGLPELLGARLNVPVSRFDALESVEIGREAAPVGAARSASTLTDLIGAAALQLRPGQPALTLLPPRWQARERNRRRRPWLVAAALLAVAALLAPIRHYREVSATARIRTEAIERELAPLREREARNRANLRQIAALRQQIAALQGIYDCRAAWPAVLADLQDRLVAVQDVWLERMVLAPATAPGQPQPAPASLRIAVSGRMLDKAHPLSRVSDETNARVRRLLSDIAGAPHIARVESERFDNSLPGVLRFDFVLVAESPRPL